jgi:small-conductance mechanosensitive channel
MDESQPWLQGIQRVLDLPLLTLGGKDITVGSVLYLVIFIVVLVWGSGMIRRVIARLLQRGRRVDVGVAQAIGSIAGYVVVLVGLLVAVQTAGIDLTTFNVLAGAVGIGVGFGLQNIASNFISGLILLVGRPIKVGDRIEVEDVEGDVIRIGARATTVVTNDNIAIIVPNSKFVSETVVNWSHNDRRVRFKIPVQVAYGTDLRLVERLLTEVAQADPDVLDDPAPTVRFMAFGESGLVLELRAWSTSLIHRKGVLMSQLNFRIYDAFAANGIEVPFPQRVVHLRRDAPA